MNQYLQMENVCTLNGHSVQNIEEATNGSVPCLIY